MNLKDLLIFAFVILWAPGITTSYAACESEKARWDEWQKKCEDAGGWSETAANNLGPLGFVGLFFAPRAKYYCEEAKRKKQEYELCIENEKLRVEYIEKEAEQRAKQVIIETRIASVIESYFDHVSKSNQDYEAAVRALVVEYVNRGLDVDDPEVSAELSERIKQIEKESVTNLLNSLKLH